MAPKTRDKFDGLILVVLGGLVSLLLGAVMEISTPTSMLDFQGVFYSSRCIIHHLDPYTYGTPYLEYLREGNRPPPDPMYQRVFHDTVSSSVYPPTGLIFLLPIALMSFKAAHILWMSLIVFSFATASALAWELASGIEPKLAGLIVGFLLGNNILVIASGNPSGIVLSLCVIAVWCLVRQRFIWVGLLCLAVAVDFKPQDAIEIWLFFLLAGVEYRKRAIQSFLAMVVLGLPAILWVWHLAPHWLPELHVNLAKIVAPGGLNDPHVSAAGYYTVNQVITLQSVLCYFRNDPAFYNSATYMICVPLLFIWAWITLRSRPSPAKTWLGLAALIPLAILPVYHRSYEPKLFLLAVPACAMLWAEGRRAGRIFVCLNSLAILLTADLPWIILKALEVRLHLPQGPSAPQLLVLIWVFPIPVVLLVAGAFNLWVYRQRMQKAESLEPLESLPPPLASISR